MAEAASHSNARHLIQLDFQLYPLEKLSPTQLAVAVLHPDWDESKSSSNSIYRLFSRLRERARSTTLPPPDISDKHDTLHLIDLNFELPRQLDSLTSDQLLALPWHPEANDTLELAALRELWRRRERDLRNNVRYIKSHTNEAAAQVEPQQSAQGAPSKSTTPAAVHTRPEAVQQLPIAAPEPSQEPVAAPTRSQEPATVPLPSRPPSPRPSTPQEPSVATIHAALPAPAAPRSPSRASVENSASRASEPPQKLLPPLPRSTDRIPNDLADSCLHTLRISGLPPGIVNSTRAVRQLFQPELRPVAALMLRPDPVRPGDVPAPRSCYAAWLDFDQRTAAMQALVMMRIASRWVPEVEIVEGKRAWWEWGDIIEYKSKMDLWRRYHLGVSPAQEQRDQPGERIGKRESPSMSPSLAPQPTMTTTASDQQQTLRLGPSASPRPTQSPPRPRFSTPEPPRQAPAPVEAAHPPREETPPRQVSAVPPPVPRPVPNLPRRPDLPDIVPSDSRNSDPTSENIDGVSVQLGAPGSGPSQASRAPVPKELLSKLVFLLFGSKRALPQEDDRSGSYPVRMDALLGPLERLAGAQPFEKKRAVLLAFEDEEDRLSAFKVLSGRFDKQYLQSYGDLVLPGDAMTEAQRRKRESQRQQTEDGWQWRHMTPAYRAAYEREVQATNTGQAAIPGSRAEVGAASTITDTDVVRTSNQAEMGTPHATSTENAPEQPQQAVTSAPVATTTTFDSRKRTFTQDETLNAESEGNRPHKQRRSVSRGSEQSPPPAQSSIVLDAVEPVEQAAESPGTPPAPAAAATDGKPAFDQSLDDEGRQLPPGWLRCWSNSQQEWYYQSPEDGTTWDNPLDPIDADESQDEEEAGSPPVDTESVPMQLDSGSPDPLSDILPADESITAENRPAIHFSLPATRQTGKWRTVSSASNNESIASTARMRVSAVPTLAARAVEPIGIRGMGTGASSHDAESFVLSDTLADRLTRTTYEGGPGGSSQQQQQQQQQGNGKRQQKRGRSPADGVPSGSGANGLLNRLDDSAGQARETSPAPHWKNKQQNSNLQRNGSNYGSSSRGGNQDGSLTSRIQAGNATSGAGGVGSTGARKGAKGASGGAVQVGKHVVSNGNGNANGSGNFGPGSGASGGGKTRQASNGGENLLNRML